MKYPHFLPIPFLFLFGFVRAAFHEQPTLALCHFTIITNAFTWHLAIIGKDMIQHGANNINKWWKKNLIRWQ